MRRTVWAALAACILISAFPERALSWGAEGHRTVGAIADLLLEKHPKTRDRVKAILDKRSLSEVSVFADCAKGFEYCHRDPSDEEEQYAKRNPDHHNYHYTDVPFQQKQYRAGTAGTGVDDVVQVIRHAMKVLRGEFS